MREKGRIVTVIIMVIAVIASIGVCTGCGRKAAENGGTEPSAWTTPSDGDESAGTKGDKQELTGISAEDVKYIYDGKTHGIEITGTESGDGIKYSVDGERYTDRVELKEVGEYTVCYRVERVGVGEYSGKCGATILPDISGTYVNEQGVIRLTHTTVIADGSECGMEYDVNGNGETERGRRFEATDEKLTTDGREYRKKKENERIYRLEINGESKYVIGGERMRVEVRFDGSKATVTADGVMVAEKENSNYCKSATTAEIERRYGTNDVTIEADGTREQTDIRIELTRLEKREIETGDRTVIYDGVEHGIGIDPGYNAVYITSAGATGTEPKYKEVNEYMYKVWIPATEKYLPETAEIKLRILPNIKGEYYTETEIIRITGITTAEINGTVTAMSYGTDGKGTIGGKEFEMTPNGLSYDGKEYKKRGSETVITVHAGATRRIYGIATENADEIYVRPGTIIDGTGAALLTVGTGTPITRVTVDGKECAYDAETDGWIIVAADLDPDSIVDIYCE